MNRERVQMLRDMMEGIPEEQVALDRFFTQNGEACNTIACIAGWAAIYPPFVEQGLTVCKVDLDWTAAYKAPSYAGLTEEQAAAKFFDVPAITFSYVHHDETGTHKQIALKRLDALLKG